MASIKELNRVYSSINLGDFYNKEYADYAIYRALQRIPNVIDGFAQTQRKSIYTMIDKNIDKKTKVSDLIALISLHTSYHHNSTSIESAITNLVPYYNNQIPLLKEDGTYGNRSDRSAAASRYIETRLYKYTKVLFNKIDNEHFVDSQEVEGKKIEPATMIPILPLLILNGQSQIGVGYASDVLPREIKSIIKIIKDLLSGKTKDIPIRIPPYAPLFNGEILEAIEKNKKGEITKRSWEYRGIAKMTTKNQIHITEVPPRYTRESYMNVLETLKDNEKIKSYTENINGDVFDIIVKIPPGFKKEGLDLLKFLKLTEKKSENLTVINTKNEIVKYDNISDLLLEFIIFTIGIYKKRKEYILKKMIDDGIMNHNKIRFIQEVNEEKIKLKGQSKSKVFDQLTTREFFKIDSSFDYLLNMRIVNLTSEEIKKLQKEIEKDEREKDLLQETTPQTMWLNDISEFEKFLKKGE